MAAESLLAEHSIYNNFRVAFCCEKRPYAGGSEFLA